MNTITDSARLRYLLWLWLFPLVVALLVAAISIIEGSLAHRGHMYMRGFGRVPDAFLYQSVFAFGFASILGYGLSRPFSALALVRLLLGLAAFTLANFVPEFGGLLRVGLVVGVLLLLTFVGAPLVFFALPAATVGAICRDRPLGRARHSARRLFDRRAEQKLRDDGDGNSMRRRCLLPWIVAEEWRARRKSNYAKQCRLPFWACCCDPDCQLRDLHISRRLAIRPTGKQNPSTGDRC